MQCALLERSPQCFLCQISGDLLLAVLNCEQVDESDCALYRVIGLGAARLAGQGQRDSTNSPGCRGVLWLGWCHGVPVNALRADGAALVGRKPFAKL